MERWAANTLRTLGIILISGFVLLTCALLLLLSMCAYGGDIGGTRHPEQGPWYIGGAAAVLIGGIWAVAVLARGVTRASRAPAVASAATPSEAISHPLAVVPLHLSPSGRKAVQNLVLAMSGQLAIAVATWVLNPRMIWRSPLGLPGHKWIFILMISSALYQIPYVILIIALLKRPDRRAFTYSIAVPAILIIQSLFGSSVVIYYFIRHPAGIALYTLPFVLNIVILVLAYKAIQQVGLHPEPSSLIVAGVVTFLYFSFIHGFTPLLYRFVR